MGLVGMGSIRFPKPKKMFRFDAVQIEPNVNSASCKMGNRDYVCVLRVNYAQSSLPCFQGKYVQTHSPLHHISS